MGRKGKPKPTQPRPLSKNEIQHSSSVYRFLKNPDATFGKALKAIGKILLWGSVVVTIVAGFFYFLPRVTVEPSGVYDPSYPSPLTFTISNINVVPLRDVQPSLGVCFISYSEPPEDINHCNGPAGSKLAFTPWFVKWLDVDEKYQIIIEDALRIKDSPKQITNADITIAVTYTPWFMPSWWRNTKEFRFITRRLSDGKIHWVPVPLNR
jgi:hypothetical protein